MRKIVNKRLLENDVDKNSFEIKYYYRDGDDWVYIYKNKDAIWNFLADGYAYVGATKFCGCVDAKHIARNANLVKIAFCDNEWVAVAVYTGYRDGFKSVGISATTDPKLRACGVAAVNKIIRTDILNFDKFFWAECNGAVEHIYEKHKGIKIPNTYAEFILGRTVDVRGEDEFHYKRNIGGVIQRKVIYGFNNEYTYELLLKEQNEYIKNCISKIKSMDIDESYRRLPHGGRYTKLDIAIQIVNLFVDLRLEDGMYEYPESSLLELKSNIKYIINALNSGTVPNNKLYAAREAVANGRDVLKTSTVMRLHRFSECL